MNYGRALTQPAPGQQPADQVRRYGSTTASSHLQSRRTGPWHCRRSVIGHRSPVPDVVGQLTWRVLGPLKGRAKSVLDWAGLRERAAGHSAGGRAPL